MREKKQINIEIGEQVKAAREQVNMTQERLAERIDVSPQFVSDLERGVVGISITTLKNICLTLGVSADRILFGKADGDRVDMLAAKCRALSEEQMLLLLNVIDHFSAMAATPEK